ncbi:GntR family transcriptional regulator, partial [Escherichia coli]|nr:GntR family transcriptional regulator [Escherichia coli]
MTKHTPLQTRIRDQLQRRFGEDLHVGDRVTEAEIADALGISRTPVRKVLWQLQNEGVVSYEQHRGFRLADASADVFDTDAEKNELLDERVMRDMALGQLGSVISERA